MDADIEIGAEAVGALNKAKELVWNARPICCGEKVSAFDDGAYICQKCEKIYE